MNEQDGEGDHLPFIDIGTCGSYKIYENLKNGIRVEN